MAFSDDVLGRRQGAAAEPEPTPDVDVEYLEDEGGRDGEDRRRPMMFMLAGLLLGGGGYATFGWLGPALVSDTMIEFRLLLLCQALGALLLLIGAIGKGVQIGLASDRARR